MSDNKPLSDNTVLHSLHGVSSPDPLVAEYVQASRADNIPVQNFNTPRGTILVSTPEATAIDLVGYQHHAGGLDQVATILSELAEKIDPKKLAVAAKIARIPWP